MLCRVTTLADTDLPRLMSGVIEDARDLAEAEVEALRTDVVERLGELGTAIKSWLIVVVVAIVMATLLGVALAATLTELAGWPWYASLWTVAGIAFAFVFALFQRARHLAKKTEPTRS